MKPVAWMHQNPDYAISKHQSLEYNIPLYTHPVKELSRMDVYELAIESGFMLSTQYGEAEHKLMPVSDGDTLVKLANAILKKAQE
jgi:predicted SpoU family rRNA methylase